MTDYAYQPDVPYAAYLKAGAATLVTFQEPAPAHAAAQAWESDLVGSPEPMAPPEVLMERQEWHTGYEGADSPFHWGATQCLLDRGKFAASLDEARSSGLSRAEKWAIEQYEQARDAFKRGHIRESLAAVLAGLRGGAGRQGNPADYRLLFLLGLIRLGSFENTDPELLDLAAAQEAFSAAARNSAAVNPADAAWAHLAAAWAAYCRGEWHAAISGARQALLLRSRFGEAEYLVAKSLLRQRRPEPVKAALAAAIAVHPSFARRALRDPDFADYGGEVETVIKAERLRLGQRAEAAMKSALERATQMGIIEPGREIATDLPKGSGAGATASLLESATELMKRNTLFGYFEAEALATRAIDGLAAVIARSEANKRMLDQGVRQAHEAIVKLSDLEWRAVRSAKDAARELAKATDLLGGTAAALTAPNLREFLLNQERAEEALAAAVTIVEACKRSALEEAGAKRSELEAQISQTLSTDESWARCIRRGALFGAMVAGIITMYTEILTGGASIGDGDFRTLARLALLGVALTLVGAIMGAVTAPIANSTALSQREKAELARIEVEETIRHLTALRQR